MTKPRPAMPLNAQIRAEATEWLLRFNEGEVDAPAREEFNHWLRASPEHVRAYLRISAFWQESAHLGGKSTPRDIDVLVACAKAEANVFPLEFGPHPRAHDAAGRSVSSGPPKRLYWTVAATLLLAIGVGAAAWYKFYADPTFATDIGEQRTVNLPDGSTVIINARSRLKVAFTQEERVIDLREGQALFKVAKNPARPFIVRSGGASVRAVGTQFDVYRKDSGTVVTVVEGRVAVRPGESLGSPRYAPEQGLGEKTSSPPPVAEEGPGVRETKGGEVFLAAGEQALITSRSAQRSAAAHLDATTAWTRGLLVFDGAPLSEVVHEFNRQNVKPLTLSGAELADLKISGTFPASGAERIVRFLEDRFHVNVTETDEEIRISRAATPAPAAVK